MGYDLRSSRPIVMGGIMRTRRNCVCVCLGGGGGGGGGTRIPRAHSLFSGVTWMTAIYIPERGGLRGEMADCTSMSRCEKVHSREQPTMTGKDGKADDED